MEVLVDRSRGWTCTRRRSPIGQVRRFCRRFGKKGEGKDIGEPAQDRRER